MISAIIAANGDSLRFGKTNKLTIKINNEYLITKTLAPFIANSLISEIIIVCPQSLEIIIKKTINFNDKPVIFLRGGETRALSVYNGLQQVKNTKVLVHDGSRPFITKKLINDICINLKTNDAAIPFLPVTSCLKKRGDNGIISTVNRDDFFTTQTPQGFNTEDLKKAYNLWKESQFKIDIFDEAQLIEVFLPTIKINLILGEVGNNKITYKEDVNWNN